MSKKKKINKLLDKYVKKKAIVQIERNTNQGVSNIQGIILKKSDKYLQLIETDEFDFNGEIIIKRDHFDFIRCNEYDKTYKNILVGEKKISNNKPKRTKLNMSSWLTIFEDLKRKNIHIIIECEDLKKPTFNIGPIDKMNSNSVNIYYYDPTGKLESKSTRIKYKNITLLKFNDKYTTIFRKYLK